MLVVIFGASGRVGRLVVQEALQRGHTVRAAIHSTNRLGTQAGLTTVQVDVHDATAVRDAIEGSQAVISTLGSWGTKDKDIVASGMRAIIPAMEAAKIERIISLTGAEARDSSDRPKLAQRLSHFLASLAAGKILSDGEEHIRLLRASSLDWTVLRSPIMTGSADIFYSLSLSPPAPWSTIPRKAIVKAVLDQLDGPAYSQASPFVYRR